MRLTLLRLAAGIASFVVLDALWLGVVMKGFYRTQLAPIARMADGALDPYWPAAIPVYLLLGAGVAVFAAGRAASAGSAAAFGALFGLVVYGVYDLTNLSTLRAWPLAVTLADIAWGTVASAAAATIAWRVAR